MVIDFSNHTRLVPGCLTVFALAAAGCGSKSPPAPPAAAAPTAATTPSMPPMPASHGATPGPGAHGAPATPGAHDPAMAMMNPMPGTGHGQPETPTSNAGHAQTTASTTPMPGPGSGHSSAPMPGPGSGHSQTPMGTTPTTTPMPLAGHSQTPGGTTPMPGTGHSQTPMGTTPMIPPTPAGHSQAPTTASTAPTTPMPAGHNQNSGTTPMGTPGPTPGAGPGAGFPGGAVGFSGANGQQFAEGSPEASLSRFCAAMADSNLADAAQYVSPKAKGLLAQIREGTMTDEKIESLKESFQSLTPKPSRSTGAGRSMSLTNGKEALNFTLMKEDDVYMLRELKISKLGR